MVKQQPQDPMPADLRLTRRVVGDAVVVGASGAVDMSTAQVLQSAAQEALDEAGTGVCVVDLTEVTFLASAGLTALLVATEHARHRGVPLRIVVDANRPVIRPIQVTGLDDVLALFHSVEEALAAERGHSSLGEASDG